MASVEPQGGDPACWLDQVCERCGRFVERPDDHECAPASPPDDVSPPAN
jgi:uncharacterized protein